MSVLSFVVRQGQSLTILVAVKEQVLEVSQLPADEHGNVDHGRHLVRVCEACSIHAHLERGHRVTGKVEGGKRNKQLIASPVGLGDGVVVEPHAGQVSMRPIQGFRVSAGVAQAHVNTDTGDVGQEVPVGSVVAVCDLSGDGRVEIVADIKDESAVCSRMLVFCFPSQVY